MRGWVRGFGVVMVVALGGACVAAPPPPARDVGGAHGDHGDHGGGAEGGSHGRPSPRCALPGTGGDFTAANPADEGVDPTIVGKVIDAIAPQLTTSFRIYRHDCLVGRTLLDDVTARQPQQFFSMTKTVVSLLVGKAISMGRLRLDDPIGRYLPEADAAHGAITVRQLLTQTSGLTFAWANDLLGSIDDSEKTALSLPFAHQPGTYFEYAQTTVTLLGIVVQRAVDEDLQAFADTELFGPIGITHRDWSWARDGKGATHGYAWLLMTPIAAARLGELVLHRGAWNGDPVIDAAYIDEMGKPTPTNGGYGLLTPTNAGIGGWTSFGRHWFAGRRLPAAPADTVEFSGFLDQAIFVVPSLDLVVVRFGIAAREGWDYELFRTLTPAVRGVHYVDPGPFVPGPSDVPFEQLVNVPLLLRQIFGT
ncbi:MAG: serine hydrolase [Acidimicrobiia bacterium]